MKHYADHAGSIRRAAQLGDDLPVAWKHRSERYTEKLATPDTSVADLVGDARRPIKVAGPQPPRDPETIAYRLIRGRTAAHRRGQRAAKLAGTHPGGDAQRHGGARHQVRGYTLRLPLDVLVVASIAPRLHQPWPHHHAHQDRFGAEIRTYPLELEAEMGVDPGGAPDAQVPTT